MYVVCLHVLPSTMLVHFTHQKTMFLFFIVFVPPQWRTYLHSESQSLLRSIRGEVLRHDSLNSVLVFNGVCDFMAL